MLKYLKLTKKFKKSINKGLYYFAKRNETKRHETKSGEIEQN